MHVYTELPRLFSPQRFNISFLLRIESGLSDSNSLFRVDHAKLPDARCHGKLLRTPRCELTLSSAIEGEPVEFGEKGERKRIARGALKR